MCEILMLIFGIITLIRGRFLLMRVKEVRGWPARLIGTLLVMPFPLSFFVGMVIGAFFLAMGKNIQDQDFKTAALVAEFSIVALCFFAAIGVAMFYAEPIRKKQSEGEDLELPEDYDERFHERSRGTSESQDITKGSPRPSPPPDDRVQG